MISRSAMCIAKTSAEWYLENINDYIGQAKVLWLVDLTKAPVGIIDDSAYCGKRLILTRDSPYV